MKRRDFVGAAGVSLLGFPALAAASKSASSSGRVLVLVELKGGNDGLNTVVPYADAMYTQLRSTIAIPPADVLKIDSRFGLHPELAALLPAWERNELAIVHGVGYPGPNLSHFRSIEIWETASRADEYLHDGWVARAMHAGLAKQAAFTAEGVRVGAGSYGPLAGCRAVTLNNPESFVRGASNSPVHDDAPGNAALSHIIRVEQDVARAADGLRGDAHAFATAFPDGGFGNAVRAAAQVIASQRGRTGVPVVVLSLGSFDTHQNQLGTHANLLRQLGQGLAALRSSLVEIGAWDHTLVMTFSEFGRRARQNQSNGTDHGTAAAHFVMGGAVRGGFVGLAPDLTRLDAGQNLVHTTDFRQIYATVARDWWGVKPQSVVRGEFETLKLLRT
ncbi:MAG TPA: DUF1501 domain-containing protein [Ramlibacter sp.]|nr:DUF1501 domain-containing protein [Ramlibacter sp.]